VDSHEEIQPWCELLVVSCRRDRVLRSERVRIHRRHCNGLDWGHSVDIISTTAGGGVQNPLCLACDWGVSDIDIRHSLVLSWSYELPFGNGKLIGKNWTGPMQTIFGGWKLNSIDTFQSGSPFSVSSSVNTEGSGGGHATRQPRRRLACVEPRSQLVV
jgi:hypothetical protein